MKIDKIPSLSTLLIDFNNEMIDIQLQARLRLAKVNLEEFVLTCNYSEAAKPSIQEYVSKLPETVDGFSKSGEQTDAVIDLGRIEVRYLKVQDKAAVVTKPELPKSTEGDDVDATPKTPPTVKPLPVENREKFWTSGPTFVKAASGEGDTQSIERSILETRSQVSDSASTIKVPKASYESFINQFNLLCDGDIRERKFSVLQAGRWFTSYEKAWKLLIVPLTRRILLMPNIHCYEISIRPNVSKHLQLMAQFHYSMMRSLTLAESKLNTNVDGAYAEFFMHLENAFEQAELFLFMWCLTFLRPRPAVLRKIGLGHPSLRLRDERKTILKGLLGCNELSEFYLVHGNTQVIRDCLLHGPSFFTLATVDGDLVPNISSIAQSTERSPQYWYNLNNLAPISGQFVYEEIHKKRHFERAVKSFDALWAALLPEFKQRFFDNTNLASYAINLEI